MSAKYIQMLLSIARLSRLCHDTAYVTNHIMLSNKDGQKYFPWTGEMSCSVFALGTTKATKWRCIIFTDTKITNSKQWEWV